MMNVRQIVELVDSSWNDALPGKEVAQVLRVKELVPHEHHMLIDSLIDSKLSNVASNPSSTTLLLLHGIQTDGTWHKLVENELRDIDNLNVVSLGYECVTALQLACPWRKGPIDKITREMRDALYLDQGSRFVVIAHSFGTYILSKIISSHPDIEFERIILCGSIINTSFRWDTYTKHMKPNSIINDVGTKDFYPVLATFSTFGYGASGRRGFMNSRVKDRYFNYGHSDFFIEHNKHIERFWKPLIKDGDIVSSDWDRQKPKLSFPTLALCNPWIGRTVFWGAISLGLLWWLA